MNCEKITPYGDTGRSKSSQVEEMFNSIAPAYDFMNTAMSFGLHRRWLRKALSMINRKNPPGPWLDVATGTADVAISLARLNPQVTITGIDLSEGMLDLGRAKVQRAGLSNRITLQKADCLQLPFESGSFGLVTVAYGVRNFQQLQRGISEMARVLKPGGMISVIELSTPTLPIVKPFYNLYTRHIIPSVGRIASKDVRAYSYLPESIAAVPQGKAMDTLLADAGLVNASHRPLTLGTCTIYTAYKPNK
ncbi:MAG: bifunctional demethylmenaquinone methyltransferase/2-methoxy-6-polyprenyl-1,4-benzoquinol methylase UbiE [Firmicutes bacterium]|nr:bifunctional demethylmenaquinone methyltransferase/2-methoxy-6-polyprenyl-1,4-benzoquinol methylase UbiE [Bacillota bacterium]MCM1400386.1 bifunctional demethylmenaquinone methyltransferase/2-methoxy-6-polyprenyl-1,4-benzoquinol methylase UbiE [Bacteroides sp.]MCM1477143.1 bifunctional demethylmenaquinone methyltransferase/2-methoxy-6-polyprenyl-1,4-benzoquinol methylase UbiE [Bacteroides sp.]